MSRAAALAWLTAALLALALGATLLALAPAAARAAECPRTSLADIEDEVMCPVCGTALGIANAPQAKRERELIRSLVAKCMTKDEVKQRLVAEFGPRVLALPERKGFNLAVYVVPIAAVLLGLLGLAIALPRWRRRRPAGIAPATEADPIQAADARRLADDLARYDI